MSGGSGGTVRSRYVDLPWGQVHVRGNLDDVELPPVLLLHQNPLSLVTYENVLEPLSAHVRAVAVDTPGFGGSDAPGAAWTIPEYAETIRSVADRLGMERPVVVGQHTGACLAIEMALQDPAGVAGVVLVGVPNVTPEVAEARLDAKHPFRITPDGAHLGYIWHRMQEEQYPGQLTPELATRHVVDHLLAGPDRYLHAYRAVYTYPIQERLRALAASVVPALLLSGEHDCIKSLHDSTSELLPQAPTVTMPGCSDFIMDEDPDGFVREVSGFVAIARADGAPALGSESASTSEPQILYTAVVGVEGGRAGRAISESGHLEVNLARPAERGTGAGTDPEELFAAGFAACFDSSLAAAARRERLRVGPTRTTASVSLCADAAQQYSIAVRLQVEVPGCGAAELRRLIETAKDVCPYSKAVRGNIDVVVTGQSAEGEIT